MDIKEFQEYCSSLDDPSEKLLAEIYSLYEGKWPISLKDPDLRTLLTTIYRATSYFRPRNVLQTGTFLGTSSVAVAIGLEETSKGMLYTIDPEPPEYFRVDNPVDAARNVIGSSRLAPYVKFIRGYSTIPLDATRIDLIPAPHWQLQAAGAEAEFDLYIIDGDHTHWGCFLDLMYGVTLMAKDGPGIILVHDYLGIPDVRNAVDEFRRHYPKTMMRVVPSPSGIAIIQL